MMINWIRKILGIISIEENLNKIYLENSKANESILNIISDSSKGILNLENKINELNPDLVFMDIQMPEIDGLSVLKELKHMPLVIFTTAFNQYAINAFELHAIDYLLKPFDKDRFSQAIQKVIEHKGSFAYFERKINYNRI